MANNILPRPLTAIKDRIVDQDGKPTPYFLRILQDVITRSDKVLTNNGEVQAQANVTSRTEPLSTTLQHVDATGKLNSTDSIASDGTGSPLQGGKNGFQGLTSSGQLKGTFKNNQVNVSGVPTSTTVLSNNGTTTVITIAAFSVQFGDGLVSYNGGSVDPGVFGTFFIYANDPSFQGGAVSYQFSATPADIASANGLILVGAITTVNGSAGTGGGSTGGSTSGGSGGRGFPPIG